MNKNQDLIDEYLKSINGTEISCEELARMIKKISEQPRPLTRGKRVPKNFKDPNQTELKF